MTHFIAALAIAVAVVSADDAPLRQRVVSTTSLTMDRVIVGRASCGRSTWLLTEAPALIELAGGTPRLNLPVRGFDRDEHPWGLACVADDELWTLADYRTLARISASGEVTLRTKLRQPRLNVFGAGELLLLQQPATAANVPLLSATRPPDINRTEPWPGPTTLTEAAKKTDLPSGLVACGLGYLKRLPCWITTQTRITISDGAPMGTSIVQPMFLGDTAHDPRTPVWDVAVAQSRLWILTTAVSGEAGRRAGARITRTNSRGERLSSMDLEPRGRLIVGASDRAAMVLTSAGTVVEVATR